MPLRLGKYERIILAILLTLLIYTVLDHYSTGINYLLTFLGAFLLITPLADLIKRLVEPFKKVSKRETDIPNLPKFSNVIIPLQDIETIAISHEEIR